MTASVVSRLKTTLSVLAANGTDYHQDFHDMAYLRQPWPDDS
jgi:hypothetical protein